MSSKISKLARGGVIALGLVNGGIGSLLIERSISGAVGTELVQNNPSVSPEQISSTAGEKAAYGTLETLVTVGGIAYWARSLRKQAEPKRG